MDCTRFRELHLAYLDGALGELELVAAERHLAECPECAQHDTTVRRGLMIARSLKPLEVSEDFAERLQRRLQEVRQQDRLAALAGARRPGQHGPGLGPFAAAATGIIAAGLLAASVLDRLDTATPTMMAPVVATLPDLPIPATPAFVASVMPVAAVFPAVLLDEAPVHFATAELRGR